MKTSKQVRPSGKTRRASPDGDLPAGLAAPARRALAAAGIQRLEQLTKFSEDDVKQLHGIGPNALSLLRSALASRGLAFKGDQRMKTS